MPELLKHKMSEALAEHCTCIGALVRSPGMDDDPFEPSPVSPRHASRRVATLRDAKFKARSSSSQAFCLFTPLPVMDEYRNGFIHVFYP